MPKPHPESRLSLEDIFRLQAQDDETLANGQPITAKLQPNDDGEVPPEVRILDPNYAPTLEEMLQQLESQDKKEVPYSAHLLLFEYWYYQDVIQLKNWFLATRISTLLIPVFIFLRAQARETLLPEQEYVFTLLLMIAFFSTLGCYFTSYLNYQDTKRFDPGNPLTRPPLQFPRAAYDPRFNQRVKAQKNRILEKAQSMNLHQARDYSEAKLFRQLDRAHRLYFYRSREEIRAKKR